MCGRCCALPRPPRSREADLTRYLLFIKARWHMPVLCVRVYRTDLSLVGLEARDLALAEHVGVHLARDVEVEALRRGGGVEVLDDGLA